MRGTVSLSAPPAAVSAACWSHFPSFIPAGRFRTRSLTGFRATRAAMGTVTSIEPKYDRPPRTLQVAPCRLRHPSTDAGSHKAGRHRPDFCMGKLHMPSHARVLPKLLNSQVASAWSTVLKTSCLTAHIRRATYIRPVFTIQLAESMDPLPCLHIRPLPDGFMFARSDETASDLELNWGPPAPWALLGKILTKFASQKMPQTPALAA